MRQLVVTTGCVQAAVPGPGSEAAQLLQKNEDRHVPLQARRAPGHAAVTRCGAPDFGVQVAGEAPGAPAGAPVGLWS